MQAENISVEIGRIRLLHGVSFQARPGQITAIVGPNGSGKSTLLKAVTGEHRYKGRVVLNGRDISDLPGWELAARRGVLQQAATVAFPFTVREIVQLGHSAGRAATDPTVPDRALQLVDLEGYGPRSYQVLSGGEQQRAQLARVLAQVWSDTPADPPNWLFLDEPVSSLDIGHQYIVMDLMRRFADQGGGVVTVLHDLNLTAMYADHVVMMQSGRVLTAGSARDTLTTQVLTQAYGCPITVNAPAPAGMPFVLPQARLARGG